MAGPRVAWQVKFVALVLIWGSSFLLMKVGLESLEPVQISGLRIVTGAVVVTALLLAGGGRLPRGARVWGHLLVCGLLLATLPFTLFALSETRISSALAGIGNAATPIATVLATLALLPGARVTGRRLVAVGVGFLGVVTIMQPWTSTEGPDLVGFAMALAGGASYGVGWTYNRRFLAGADLGGLAMPAATLLTGLALMVPTALGWALTRPEGLGALWAHGAATDVPAWLPLACVLVLGSWVPASPTSCSSTSSGVPGRWSARRSPTSSRSSRCCSACSCSTSGSGPGRWSASPSSSGRRGSSTAGRAPPRPRSCGSASRPPPDRAPGQPSAGARTSRRRILPVGPLGSASTTHTLRGYL